MVVSIAAVEIPAPPAGTSFDRPLLTRDWGRITRENGPHHAVWRITVHGNCLPFKGLGETQKSKKSANQVGQ
jgi:hypothetical protein